MNTTFVVKANGKYWKLDGYWTDLLHKAHFFETKESAQSIAGDVAEIVTITEPINEVYSLLEVYPEYVNNPAESKVVGVFTNKEKAYEELEKLRGTKARYVVTAHKIQ